MFLHVHAETLRATRRLGEFGLVLLGEGTHRAECDSQRDQRKDSQIQFHVSSSFVGT
jgi:hypothetical protein